MEPVENKQNELYGPFIELETNSEFYKRKFLFVYKKILYSAFLPSLIVYSFIDNFFYQEGYINKRYGVFKISFFIIGISLGTSLIATPLVYRPKSDYFANIYNKKKLFFETLEEENLRNLNKDLREIEKLNNK